MIFFLIHGFAFRVTGYGLRVTGYEFRVASSGLRVSSYAFRVASSGLRVPGFGLRVPGCELRVTCFAINSYLIYGCVGAAFSRDFHFDEKFLYLINKSTSQLINQMIAIIHNIFGSIGLAVTPGPGGHVL